MEGRTFRATDPQKNREENLKSDKYEQSLLEAQLAGEQGGMAGDKMEQKVRQKRAGRVNDMSWLVSRGKWRASEGF